MPVCPRQCHFGCVLVGIEHGVHEREARVALDAVACTRSLSKECHCRPTVIVTPVALCTCMLPPIYVAVVCVVDDARLLGDLFCRLLMTLRLMVCVCAG